MKIYYVAILVAVSDIILKLQSLLYNK